MNKIKVVNYIEFKNLLGEAVKIHLKDGGAFNFKITGYTMSANSGEPAEAVEIALNGFDDNGTNLQIDINDIDFVLGG